MEIVDTVFNTPNYAKFKCRHRQFSKACSSYIIFYQFLPPK